MTFNSPFDSGGANPSGIAVSPLQPGGLPAVAVTHPCNPSGSTCTQPGIVTVFKNNGDGTFTGAPPIPVGLDPTAVQFGDVNGDGFPDLIVANTGDNTVSILVNDPASPGTFLPPVPFATAATSTDVAIGDWNGDGKPDLAVTASGPFPGVVSVLLGNGDGSFQAKVDYTVGVSPVSVAVGDVNGDGKSDLIVANLSSNTVSVLPGKGDGTFKPQVAYYSGGNFPAWAGTVDENGDGALDIVVANKADTTFNANGNLAFLLGAGDGTFGTPAMYAAGSADISAPGLSTADLNGDGKPDLIVSNSTDNDVSVFLNLGNGTFGPKASFATTRPGPNAVATGDFNGDGKPDVVVTTNSLFGNLFLGKGDGTFQPATNLPNAGGVAVITGDYNGDGKLDIVTSSGVLLGNGDGTFQPPGGCGTVGLALVAGDFNRDGKLDLAVSSLNSVSILIGNGDGTCQPPATITVSGGGSIATGDFNGDGKPDLAVIGPEVTTIGGGSAVVSVLLGNGDGTFQAPVDYPSGTSPANVIAGDVNEDGIPDLVVTDSLEKNVSVLVGKGDGTFQFPLHLGPGTAVQPAALVASDFNADGAIDLAVAGFDGKVYVYLNSIVIGLFPNSLTFANQPLGTTSAAQTVTVSNPGPAPLGISSFVASGDFAQSNTCGTTLAVETNCAINITFTPTATGIRPGAVTITDTAPTSPQTIALNGVNATSMVTVTPASLTFAGQAVGTTSAPQAVTFTNTGASAVAIASITVSGDFAQTNTCGASVAAGANCAINVTFTPTAAGARAGTLTITDSDSSSPQTVSLSGTGAAPAVSLSPTSLSFGNQAVGSTSSAQTVTLTNTGGGTLNVSGITIGGTNSGDFAQSNTCAATVAAGANCAISATFKPTATGARTGTVTITDDAPGSPHTVALSGNGTDFSITPAAGSTTSATVTAGQKATFNLSFAPAAGFNQSIALSCTGAPSLATCTVSPMSVTLDGTNPATATVTVTTTARSLLGPWSKPRLAPPGLGSPAKLLGLLCFLALATLAGFETARLAGRRWRPAGLALALALLLGVVGLTASACGGGEESPPAPSGTPAGTFSLTVTATSGGVSHNIALSLTVQ